MSLLKRIKKFKKRGKYDCIVEFLASQTATLLGKDDLKGVLIEAYQLMQYGTNSNKPTLVDACVDVIKSYTESILSHWAKNHDAYPKSVFILWRTARKFRDKNTMNKCAEALLEHRDAPYFPDILYDFVFTEVLAPREAMDVRVLDRWQKYLDHAISKGGRRCSFLVLRYFVAMKRRNTTDMNTLRREIEELFRVSGWSKAEGDNIFNLLRTGGVGKALKRVKEKGLSHRMLSVHETILARRGGESRGLRGSQTIGIVAGLEPINRMSRKVLGNMRTINAEKK